VLIIGDDEHDVSDTSCPKNDASMMGGLDGREKAVMTVMTAVTAVTAHHIFGLALII